MGINVVEKLRKAASIMKERGHARYQLEDLDGKVCLMGAINCALYRDPIKWTKTSDRLRTAVEVYLARKFKWRRGAVEWNNHIDREGSEVIAALRGAARIAAARQ